MDFWLVEEEPVPELIYDDLENEIYNEYVIPIVVEQNLDTTLPTQSKCIFTCQYLFIIVWFKYKLFHNLIIYIELADDEQNCITEPIIEHTDLETFGDECIADFDSVRNDFGGGFEFDLLNYDLNL
ncbi:hypothetical protein KSP40_PGU005651 [Platanthera guangdongensis]|uniref:Uncharacterized protein n=1 Tax=Platanthera guangdongensis TaxID=2320717 RepID=A0ABR2LCM1_9ASPA